MSVVSNSTRKCQLGEGKTKQKVGVRLGTRLDPRAEERLRRVSSSGGDEFVG